MRRSRSSVATNCSASGMACKRLRRPAALCPSSKRRSKRDTRPKRSNAHCALPMSMTPITCEPAPGTSPATRNVTVRPAWGKATRSPTRTPKACKAPADKNSASASNRSSRPSALGNKDGDTCAALKMSKPNTVKRSVCTTSTGLRLRIPKSARRWSQASMRASSMSPKGGTSWAEACPLTVSRA